MNYLAHAYFSNYHPEILLGNLISDFIKGKKQFDYPEAIQKGIKLHRAIDHFTDKHPAMQQAKQVFKPHYRLYAGAFTDIAMDYFVANDTQFFAQEADLEQFAQWVYSQLRRFEYYIPDRAKGYFLRMQQQNWLYHYRSFWGIEKSFRGLVYRSTYLNDSATAANIFAENLPLLQSQYEAFVPDLLAYLSQQTDYV
jgi:acyl carrier protein phosphodiesterase